MNTRPSLRWQSFWVPKRDHPGDDYEDAFAADPKRGSFAVADGASETSFAGRWARLLTTDFVRAVPDGTQVGDWLRPLRQSWADEVDGLSLPWYAEEKRDLGAFAAFLGLVIDCAGKQAGRWSAWAVGDSCLFQVRQNELIAAFPLDRASEFGIQPALLCSRAGTRKEPAVLRSLGDWEPGDHVFLMTDALAQWFLKRHESKRLPWQSLLYRLADSKMNAALTAYVEQLRDKNELKNDDVTLLAISL